MLDLAFHIPPVQESDQDRLDLLSICVLSPLHPQTLVLITFPMILHASTRSCSPTPFLESQRFRSFAYQFPTSYPWQGFRSCEGCHGDEDGNCNCIPSFDDDSDEEVES